MVWGCPLGVGGPPDPPDPLSPRRVRLSKRRARAGVQSGTNAVLVVKHRDMNEKELEAQVGSGGLGVWGGVSGPPRTPLTPLPPQEARRAQLENHEPEEEEEEEMEAEKEAAGSGLGGA